MEVVLVDILDFIIIEGVGDIIIFSVGELDWFIWVDWYCVFVLYEFNFRVKMKYLDVVVVMDWGMIVGIGSLVKDFFG